MGSICLLSDGGLPSVSCVTHYSFVRSFVRSFAAPRVRPSNDVTWVAWQTAGWSTISTQCLNAKLRGPRSKRHRQDGAILALPRRPTRRCRQMSVSTPEDLARKIESHGVACTDTDVANRLLTHLRHAQAMGSPDSPEPLEVFARAGGVAALAAAMKANTPVAADWLEGTRPASGIDLAMVQKEGCGVLNNIAASALAGGAAP